MNLPEGYTLDEPLKADAGNASLPDGFILDQPVTLDVPEGFTLDSPPAEPPANTPFLPGASNPQGVLPMTEATDPGSMAFKDALEKAKQESALKAAGREAAMGVVPTLAGIGGGVATGAATGAGLGALGLNPVTAAGGAVVGGIVGGIGAAVGADWLQGKAIQAIAPEQAAQLELERAAAAQVHPYATLAGSLAPQLLVMKPSFKNVAGAFNAAKAIGKGTLNVETQAGKDLMAQLGNVGIGAGVQGAQEAYAQYQAGDLNAGRLLAQIVAGAVINEPNKFGVKMGLHPTTGEPELVEAPPVRAETPPAEVAPVSQEVAPVQAQKWYRGTPPQGAELASGDTFYSASRGVADEYSNQLGQGKVGEITEHGSDVLPSKTLTVESKESLAKDMGLNDTDAFQLDFDAKAKEYAKSKGFEAILYENGTQDFTTGERAQELHVFKQPQPPLQPRPGESTITQPSADTITPPLERAVPSLSDSTSVALEKIDRDIADHNRYVEKNGSNKKAEEYLASLQAERKRILEGSIPSSEPVPPNTPREAEVAQSNRSVSIAKMGRDELVAHLEAKGIERTVNHNKSILSEPIEQLRNTAKVLSRQEYDADMKRIQDARANRQPTEKELAAREVKRKQMSEDNMPLDQHTATFRSDWKGRLMRPDRDDPLYNEITSSIPDTYFAKAGEGNAHWEDMLAEGKRLGLIPDDAALPDEMQGVLKGRLRTVGEARREEDARWADETARADADSGLNAADDEVPFRTVLGEAKGGDAGRAKWIIRKTLGPKADVEIVDRIFERGAERLGKYQKGLVTIAKGGNMDRTAYHEAMHGAEDMLFTAKELDAVKRIMPDAEKRADAFMDYATGKQGVTGQVKMYFDRLMYRIKKLFGQADGISELKAIHAKLMQGVMAKRGAKAGTGEVVYRTPAEDFHAKMDKADDAFKKSQENKSPLMRRIRDWTGRNLATINAPVNTREKALGKAVGDTELALKSYQLRQAQQGVGSYANDRFEGWNKTLKTDGIKTEEDVKNLGRYMMAERTLELYDKKPEVKHPVTREEAQAALDAYKASPDAAKFEAAAKSTRAEFKKSLDALEKSGVISKQSRKDIENSSEFYMPRKFLDHIDPIVREENSRLGTVEVRESGVRFLKEGSEGDMITDPMLSVAQNILHAESIAAKNKSIQALAELTEKATPDMKKVENTDWDMTPIAWDAVPRKGYDKIQYWVDGKAKALEVRSDLATALKMVDPAIASDTARLARLLSGTSAVKFMATSGNPEFSIGNIFRDFGLQFLAGKEWSNILPVAVAQQLKQALSVTLSTKLRRDLRKAYSMYGGGNERLSTSDFFPETINSNTYQHSKSIMKKIVHAMGFVGNRSEELGRLSLLNQALRNMGKDVNSASADELRKAVSSAKEIINFQDHGRLVKAVDTVIPFLNPAFQGGRSIFRGFKERPVSTTMKAMQIVAASALVAQWNRKNDEKASDSVSDADKMSKLNIMLNAESKDKDGHTRYGYLGIPVDQAWRPFIVLGQMIADKQAGKEVDTSLLTKTIGANYIPVDFSNLPPVMSAVLTYSQNHDFWKGDKVWRGRDVDPIMERKMSTPSAAIAAGDVTGLSPERLAAAGKKLLPTNPITYGFEMLAEMLDTDAGRKMKEDNMVSLAQQPFIRRIFRTTSPRDLSHDDVLAAKRLKIDYKNRANAAVLNDIDKAARKQNTYRQKNDVTFDKLVARVRAGDLTKTELYKAAWQVKNEQGKFDGKERVRILRRLKERYPEVKIVAPSGS